MSINYIATNGDPNSLHTTKIELEQINFKKTGLIIDEFKEGVKFNNNVYDKHGFLLSSGVDDVIVENLEDINTAIDDNTTNINTINGMLINDYELIVNNDNKLMQKVDESVYNAKILLIDTDITNLKTDVTNIKTDITDIDTDLTLIKSDITTAKADIITAKTDITAIQTNISDNIYTKIESDDKFNTILDHNSLKSDVIDNYTSINTLNLNTYTKLEIDEILNLNHPHIDDHTTLEDSHNLLYDSHTTLSSNHNTLSTNHNTLSTAHNNFVTATNNNLDLKRNISDSYSQTAVNDLLDLKRDLTNNNFTNIGVSNLLTTYGITTANVDNRILFQYKILGNIRALEIVGPNHSNKTILSFDPSVSYTGLTDIYMPNVGGTIALLSNITTELNNYYNKTVSDDKYALITNLTNHINDTTTKLNLRYLKTETDTLLNNYRLITDSYTIAQVDTALNLRYLKTEVNTLLNNYRLITDSYTISQTDVFLNDKVFNSTFNSFVSTTNGNLDLKRNISDSYSQTAVNDLLVLKRNINDSYSISQIDTSLSLKRDISDSYSQTAVNDLLVLKRNINDSYSISQIDTSLSLKRDLTNTNFTNIGVSNLLTTYGITTANVDNRILFQYKILGNIRALEIVGPNHNNKTILSFDPNVSYTGATDIYMPNVAGTIALKSNITTELNNYYNKTVSDDKYALITNSYNQTEINNLLNAKRNILDSHHKNDVFTKTEINNSLSNYRLISNTSFGDITVSNTVNTYAITTSSVSNTVLFMGKKIGAIDEIEIVSGNWNNKVILKLTDGSTYNTQYTQTFSPENGVIALIGNVETMLNSYRLLTNNTFNTITVDTLTTTDSNNTIKFNYKKLGEIQSAYFVGGNFNNRVELSIDTSKSYSGNIPMYLPNKTGTLSLVEDLKNYNRFLTSYQIVMNDAKTYFNTNYETTVPCYRWITAGNNTNQESGVITKFYTTRNINPNSTHTNNSLVWTRESGSLYKVIVNKGIFNTGTVTQESVYNEFSITLLKSTFESDRVLKESFNNQVSTTKKVWLDIDIQITYFSKEYEFRFSCVLYFFLMNSNYFNSTISFKALGNDKNDGLYSIGGFSPVHNPFSEEYSRGSASIKKRVLVSLDDVNTKWTIKMLAFDSALAYEGFVRINDMKVSINISPYEDTDFTTTTYTY